MHHEFTVGSRGEHRHLAAQSGVAREGQQAAALNRERDASDHGDGGARIEPQRIDRKRIGEDVRTGREILCRREGDILAGDEGCRLLRSLEQTEDIGAGIGGRCGRIGGDEAGAEACDIRIADDPWDDGLVGGVGGARLPDEGEAGATLDGGDPGAGRRTETIGTDEQGGAAVTGHGAMREIQLLGSVGIKGQDGLASVDRKSARGRLGRHRTRAAKDLEFAASIVEVGCSQSVADKGAADIVQDEGA